MNKKRKNTIIAAAMIAVLAIAGISAYFTATDSNTNTFTVGNVQIDQKENGDEDVTADDILPNQEIMKQVTVKNTGDNDAYVFTAVAVPKKSLKVANTTSGVGGVSGETGDAATNPALDDNAVLTQLFQLNGQEHADTAANSGETTNSANAMLAAIAGKTDTGVTSGVGATKSITGAALPVAQASNDADVWTGVDTWNASWYMLDVNADQSTSIAEQIFSTTGVNAANLLDHYNVYIFAYGSNAALTKLAAGSTTDPVFDSVTFANVLNINDVLGTSNEDSIDYNANMEDRTPQILVKSFAIQADNVADNSSGAAAPITVWNILNNQDGAYRAIADELYDYSRGWWAAPQETSSHSVDGTVVSGEVTP